MPIKILDAGPVDNGYVVIVEVNGRQYSIPTDESTSKLFEVMVNTYYKQAK